VTPPAAAPEPAAAEPAAAAPAAARSAARQARTRATGPAPRVPSAPQLRLVPGGAGRVRAPGTGTGSRRAPFVLLVVALLVATTIGLLVLNTAIAVNSLKATELRTANAEKAEEVQELEQQVVVGSTPAELAAAAAATGLVPAGPAAYLVIGPDGTATLRGTPEPAPGGAPPPAAGG
jgi:cell division protein FtsI (penicillin-binding protein 3)